LGLNNNARLFNRSKDTQNNHSWVKFISSDMIDNVDFHKILEKRHPGFNISGPKSHRFLFHWAFESEPWNEELETRVKEYCDTYDLNIESNIRVFKDEILYEQKRRNRLIKEKTKEAFEFAGGGTQEYIYVHFFASMAYNVHILGDYTTDNQELNGLCNFDKLVGEFVVELRKLDYANSKQIINGITQINYKNINVQSKADMLMKYLKQQVPTFIIFAQKGNLRRLLVGKGLMHV